MEVPISHFRRNLFAIVEKALDGREVWVKHKGRRLRLMPEQQPADKLSRITPLGIIVSNADIADDSWKTSMMKDWEQKWDRNLGSRTKDPQAASSPGRTRTRKTRGSA